MVSQRFLNFLPNFAPQFRILLEILRLSANYIINTTIAGCGTGYPYQRAEDPLPLRDDAVERHSFLREFGRRRAEGAQSAGGALQNLLAARFCFHLPPGPFRPRRSGPDPGFFSYGN